MKVALVYDHVNKIGGAERILVVLHELFADAPLYTLVYNPQGAPWAKNFKVIPSFLQKIVLARSKHELFPVIPVFAFEQLDLSAFDLVISLTSSEAKGVITSPHTLHICYCLTPTRYLWSHHHGYFNSKLSKIVSLPVVSWMRMWDQIASNRPDKYVAISQTVASRIHKYYKKDSVVIYPPVDTKKFTVRSSQFAVVPKDFFLVVSRLVKYKRIDIAIEACNELGLPLKIVGEGFGKKRLQKLSGPTIEFLGNLTDRELIVYYQSCRALIFGQEEDFGISAVEAQAAGKPVIAYRSGGALEIIAEGITGEFFFPQTKEALVNVLKIFMSKAYDSKKSQTQAEKFAKNRFKMEFSNFINQEWREFKKA